MENNESMVTATATAENVQTETKKEEKTFTRDELNKIVASEKQKIREELLKEQEEQRTEAEKMANMKAEEKLKYQAEKDRKEKEEAIAKLNAYELKEQAVKIAQETELDVSLVDLINFRSITAEDLNNSLKTIKTSFDKAVEKRVNERLKEPSPKNVMNNTRAKNRVSRTSI